MNEFAQQLIAALETADIKPYTDYSGRGMYGAQCVGVACGSGDKPSQEDVLEAVKNVKGALRFSTDSLGRGTILYWTPAITAKGWC